MIQEFNELYTAYDDQFKDGLRSGELPMRSTDHGFWGAASLHATFDFFRKIDLAQYDRFVDLGSGDGRIVYLASLFTDAYGIEGDPDLVERGRALDVDCDVSFVIGDYMTFDLSRFDFIFINPDKGFTDAFEQKLQDEVDGTLAVYNQIYLPSFDRDRVVWVDQVPFSLYQF
jgi:hypothetical protein